MFILESCTSPRKSRKVYPLWDIPHCQGSTLEKLPLSCVVMWYHKLSVAVAGGCCEFTIQPSCAKTQVEYSEAFRDAAFNLNHAQFLPEIPLKLPLPYRLHALSIKLVKRSHARTCCHSLDSCWASRVNKHKQERKHLKARNVWKQHKATKPWLHFRTSKCHTQKQNASAGILTRTRQPDGPV